MWVKEIAVRTKHGTMDWFNTGKEYNKAVYFHLLINLYAECVMQNANLYKSQAGVKITGRNNNLRFAYNTTLMAESEEELKSLLMKVKREG